MATDFASLKTEIRDYLTEDDTAVLPDARIEELVRFCETELNYGRGNVLKPLRVLDMQTAKETTLNYSEQDGGDENVTLPSDYLEMRALKETTNVYSGTIEAITPDEWWTKKREGPWGFIRFYSIIGGQIRLQDAPNTSGLKLEMNYYAKIPALSDENTTNWLLTKYPQLYTYGSLIHAEPFLKNTSRIGEWTELYDQTRAGILEADRRAQSSMGPRRMQVPRSVAVR